LHYSTRISTNYFHFQVGINNFEYKFIAMRTVIISCLFLLSFIVSDAQKFKLDSNYVESYKQRFIVVLHLSGQYNTLELKEATTTTTDTNSSDLSFPTFKTSLGFTFNYKWFNFSYGRNVFDVIFKNAYSNQQYLAGKTKITNYAFTYAPNRARIELYYKKISGFHEQNREFYDSTYTSGTPYLQYPEMTTRNFGADLIWTYNIRNRFSFGAPYSYTTRQLKSAGSFLFFLGTNYFDIRSDSAVIPAQVSNSYGTFDDLNYFRGLSISPGVGWGYTLVIGKVLFTNLTLIARYPYIMKEFGFTDGTSLQTTSVEEQPDALSYGMARMAAGINFKAFFVSVYAYADMYDYNYYSNRQLEIVIKNLNIRGAFNVGFRFNQLKRKHSAASL